MRPQTSAYTALSIASCSRYVVSNDGFFYTVQCILDLLPVSVSTDPVCDGDHYQFAHSYSNPFKLKFSGELGGEQTLIFINYLLVYREETILD